MTKLLTHLKKIALVLAYALILLAGISYGAPKFAKLANLKSRHQALEGTLDQRTLAVRELKHNQDRMKNDPDFVEQILHENRRIRPNEILYIFESKNQ